MAELLAMYLAFISGSPDHAPNPRIGSKGQALHGNAFHKFAGRLEDLVYQCRVLGKTLERIQQMLGVGGALQGYPIDGSRIL